MLKAADKYSTVTSSSGGGQGDVHATAAASATKTKCVSAAASGPNTDVDVEGTGRSTAPNASGAGGQMAKTVEGGPGAPTIPRAQRLLLGTGLSAVTAGQGTGERVGSESHSYNDHRRAQASSEGAP